MISKKVRTSKIMKASTFKDKVLSAISSRKKYVFEWKNVLLMVFCYPLLRFIGRDKSKVRKNFNTFKSGEQKIK